MTRSPAANTATRPSPACHLALATALMLSAASAALCDDGLFIRMYGDRRAQGVGDTLHLIIAETASASLGANESHERDTKTEIGPGTGYLDFLKALGFSASSSSSAAGASSRNNKMSARMTVRIVELTDAGNFVVEGDRSVIVNSDNESIKIRGGGPAQRHQPGQLGVLARSGECADPVHRDDPQKPGRKSGSSRR